MSVHTTTLKLVTIITERILEKRLLTLVEESGAKGYTLSQVTGRGSRGVRSSEWAGPDTKIEALVNAEVADYIVEHYAVIVYVLDANVVRGEKYA